LADSQSITTGLLTASNVRVRNMPPSLPASNCRWPFWSGAVNVMVWWSTCGPWPAASRAISCQVTAFGSVFSASLVKVTLSSPDRTSRFSLVGSMAMAML
jgi:hypothetical protein